MTIKQRSTGSLTLFEIMQEIPSYWTYLVSVNGGPYYLSWYAGLDDGVPTTKALSFGHFYNAAYDTGHYPSFSGSSKHDGVTGDFSNTATDLLPLWYENLSSSTSYLTRIIRVPKYLAGETVRIVIQYLSGSTYTGDWQIYGITTNSGTSYFFDTDAASFERESIRNASYEDYADVTWGSVTTTTQTGTFNRDYGGTGSGGTGLAGPHPTNGTNRYYTIYAETSTNNYGYPNRYFWLRSPNFTLGSSLVLGEPHADSVPTDVTDCCDEITIYHASYGATIGQYWLSLIVS